MITQFVLTVYRMAIAGQWDEMREYFALIRELIAIPALDISVGQPTDKGV